MKNTIKVLGILLIIAAAVFIAACGDLPEADKTFTVTFDSDGGTSVPSQKVKDGEKASKPADPTKSGSAAPTAAGLYKDGAGGSYTFSKWEKNGVEFNFNDPITENITLKAVWSGSGGGGPTEINVSGAQGTKLFQKAINYINSNTFTPQSGESYTLVLSLAENDSETEAFISSGAITLSKSNLKLTITSNSAGQRTIKSTVPSGVFLTLGPATGTSNTSLTLKNVVLQGSGSEVNDSLVRIQNGATLIMEDQSAVKGHKNGATTSDGLNGNGSAVCIVGATLTMKQGSVIEDNESTKDATNSQGQVTQNKNRVGGVYTIASGTTGPTLNIEGGQVINNKSKEGNTKDVYATEGGSFNLSGNVKIDEITLNADAASGTTSASNPATSYTSIIIVSNLGPQADVHLSLRSTADKD